MSQAGTQSRTAVGSAGSAATGASDVDAAAATASAASHAAPADNALKGKGGQPVQNPPAVPTQEGPVGIRFDFNDGCRVTLPPGDGDWRVLLRDTATANPLFDTQISTGVVASSKKYYVPFEIEVWSQGKEVFRHRLDLTGRSALNVS
jgi:Glycosyltransferase TibC, N-terminal domain